MLIVFGGLKMFVALEACDMFGGFNGLHVLVTELSAKIPRRGRFVFSRRRHTYIKTLCWTGTGLWVLTQATGERNFFLVEEPGAGSDQAEATVIRSGSPL
jgi:transposase